MHLLGSESTCGSFFRCWRPMFSFRLWWQRISQGYGRHQGFRLSELQGHADHRRATAHALSVAKALRVAQQKHTVRSLGNNNVSTSFAVMHITTGTLWCCCTPLCAVTHNGHPWGEGVPCDLFPVTGGGGGNTIAENLCKGNGRSSVPTRYQTCNLATISEKFCVYVPLDLT